MAGPYGTGYGYGFRIGVGTTGMVGLTGTGSGAVGTRITVSPGRGVESGPRDGTTGGVIWAARVALSALKVANASGLKGVAGTTVGGSGGRTGVRVAVRTGISVMVGVREPGGTVGVFVPSGNSSPGANTRPSRSVPTMN